MSVGDRGIAITAGRPSKAKAQTIACLADAVPIVKISLSRDLLSVAQLYNKSAAANEASADVTVTR